MNYLFWSIINLSILTVFYANMSNATNATNATNASPLYNYDMEAINGRKPQYQIHPMILARRSLKIMTGEEMTDEEIMPLLEAARWGPSNFNNQPWRFVYAKRKTTHFPKLLDLLHPKNQLWAKDASILMFMLTNKYNNYKGNKTLLVTNAFATGAAFMNMALEASARGYLVHSMAGIDRNRSPAALGLTPDSDYEVQVGIAIGKRPKERNEKTIEKVSQRHPISQLISEGVFVEKIHN